MQGFWEKTLITFFGLAFHLATDAHNVSNPNSRAYVGVGAFQLLRRSTYEAIGTHKRLAMEIVDDMKLGKLVKQSGFRSCVAIAQEFVTVRWHAGAGNVIRGVTKNFFAAFGYNLAFAAVALVGMILLNVVPFFAVFAAHGWIRIFSAIAVGGSSCHALQRGCGEQGFAAIRSDASDWRSSVLLHDRPLRRRDAVARRSDLARHVLSIERFETRRGLATPFSTPTLAAWMCPVSPLVRRRGRARFRLRIGRSCRAVSTSGCGRAIARRVRIRTFSRLRAFAFRAVAASRRVAARF